ncbi:hypothetical protein M422DRAFT_257161 [Sphaerobolus stellatus SS14]|uniref:CxC1-like cysteine cluster associated with KDZ transposases domain-containing protein n=1 Tax=Sphaerobolus stellatus (strain SS14) TaxID=990650 RepID=A0A0C9VPL0_SPHS4|nr:hypothetical protein M422DRAFT_257161 [Sphaerobolus stellatus SS14]
MSYIALNISGWALSLEWFWKECGYTLGPRDYLKRRFSAAFQWYNVLKDQSRAAVDDAIWRHSIIISPAAALDTPAAVLPVEVLTAQSAQQPTVSSPPSPPNVPSLPILLSPSSISTALPSNNGGSNLQPPLKRRRMANNNHDIPMSASFKCPSAYLRSCCPLCFGGPKPSLMTSHAHCIVALDANFAQKCQKGQYEDITFGHPHPHFIPEREVNEVAAYVEAMRSKPAKKNISVLERLPEDILMECEQQFVAADETQAKTSTAVYVDTGLVALVCRHDHLLWVINMTTAGERQYYTYTLLRQLLAHLPADWNVGLLYDIACQVEWSMLKHGILAEFYHRLCFAVSVFHTYGHDWACQLNYHPRKIVGYGLSDGEGCKRLWSSLKRLIPSLRVSGEWKDQVEYQIAPLKPDISIQRILELRLSRSECFERVKQLEKVLRDGIDMDSEHETVLLEELQAEKEGYEMLKKCLQNKEKELGVTVRQKLELLKGNEFLRHRVNSNVLKSQIWAKLVSQKFERAQLERAYQHQVMRDKDHQQSKNVLKRSRQSITKLVSRNPSRWTNAQSSTKRHQKV